MLSTNRITNYWARNALARVRFLQEKTHTRNASVAIRQDKANTTQSHNKAVDTFRKAKRIYLLEHRVLF